MGRATAAAEQKPGRTAGRMIAPVLEQLSRDYVGEASFYKASRVLASSQSQLAD